MRILYVVQRYGEGIVGGSESACRQFSERLVGRGHEVDVLTSCAHEYVDWANEYEPGDHELNGVTVHRLPVSRPRPPVEFDRIHSWMVHHPSSAPYSEQRRWTRVMGPELVGLRGWLMDRAEDYDVVVFMTYLYMTTTHGLPTVAGRVPTILQPTSHDEPPAHVSIYQSIFRQPDTFLFFTPEERRVVGELYGIESTGKTIGIGLDLDTDRGDAGRGRALVGCGNDPYLVYVGRLDASKGVGELLRFFDAYKSRNGGDLRLVLAGSGLIGVPDRPDIVPLGFLDEQTKRDVIAGSLALVQPSYFESFSIVLCEAWLEGRPALVQGRCEVLRGQAMRSAGAVPYEGFAEFEAAVDLLLGDRGVAALLGESGRAYVEVNYDWEVVLDGFEETLDIARVRHAERRGSFRPSR